MTSMQLVNMLASVSKFRVPRAALTVADTRPTSTGAHTVT